MPQVSVLVPAFRARYLDACLASVLCQSLQDFELIVSDDSDGAMIESVVSKWDDPRIRYIRNPRRQQPGTNRDLLVSLAAGRYLKLLFDDDFLLPRSLELLCAAAESTGAGMVFHGRHLVDAAGCVLASPLFVEPGRIALVHSSAIFQHMLPARLNFIGEPSNVLLRAETLRRLDRPFGLDGRRMRFLTDVALYVNMARSGLPIAGVGYLGSAFRQHEEQNSSAAKPLFAAGLFEWELLCRWSMDRGLIEREPYRRGVAALHQVLREHVGRFPELERFVVLRGSPGESGEYMSRAFEQALAFAYGALEARLSQAPAA